MLKQVLLELLFCLVVLVALASGGQLLLAEAVENLVEAVERPSSELVASSESLQASFLASMVVAAVQAYRDRILEPLYQVQVVGGALAQMNHFCYQVQISHLCH